MPEITSIAMVPNAPGAFARRVRSVHRAGLSEGEPVVNFWYPQGHCLLQFSYVNWKGKQHDYLVDPESVEFGPYDGSGSTPRPVRRWAWVMHASVIARDGEAREGTPRRTFVIEDIKYLRPVRRAP